MATWGLWEGGAPREERRFSAPKTWPGGLSPLAGPDLHPSWEAGHPVNELLPSVLRAALEGAGLEEGVLGSAVEQAGQRHR